MLTYDKLERKDQITEEVIEHIRVNSWLNMIDFDNWYFGRAASKEAVEQALFAYTTYYEKIWFADSPEDSQYIMDYFKKIGCEELGHSDSNGGAFFVAKKSF